METKISKAHKYFFKKISFIFNKFIFSKEKNNNKMNVDFKTK
jgi:hypothetical protein